MKRHTFFLKLIQFRLGHFALGQICIILYYLSLAFSGLIARAFFEHLTGQGIGLSLLTIVGLQTANTLLAMVGLGVANYPSHYVYAHAMRALLIKNMLYRILQLPGQCLGKTTSPWGPLSTSCVMTWSRPSTGLSGWVISSDSS